MTFCLLPKAQRPLAFFSQTFLAVDFGHKKVGLSYYTPGHIPLPVMLSPIFWEKESLEQSWNFLFHSLTKIIEELRVQFFLIGHPRKSDGELGGTPLLPEFIERVKEKYPNISFFYHEEYLTSQEAKQRLFKKRRPFKKQNVRQTLSSVDSMAAKIFLEEFFDEW